MEVHDAIGGAGSSSAEPQGMPVRRDDVVLHELDGEALVYDSRSGAVHRLNAITLFVWNACDGSRTTQDIARDLTERYAIDSDETLVEVEWIVEELARRDLLQDTPAAGFDPRPPRVGPRRLPTMSEQVPPAAQAVQDNSVRNGSRDLSRRELLSGGATKLVFVAPVISTFFAAGAYASGPSASGAYGVGCKNVPYSCTTNNDCCEAGTKTACQNGSCCVQHNQTGCTVDTDCCNGPDVCNAGTCD